MNTVSKLTPIHHLESECKKRWHEFIGDAFGRHDQGEIIPTLIENGVPSSELAIVVGQVLNQPVFEVSENIATTDKGYGWVLAEKVAYLSNPFDSTSMRELQRHRGREIKQWGVVDHDAVSEVVSKGKSKSTEDMSHSAMQGIASIMKRGLNQKASDIHLVPVKDRIEVRLRIDGELVKTTQLPNDDMYTQIANKLLDRAGGNGGEFTRPYSGKFSWRVDDEKTVDVRLEMAPTRTNGENKPKFTLRIIGQDSTLVGLNKLGLPESESNPQLTLMKKIAGMVNGIVLVTGPTGSGKSTTLMAWIRYIKNMYPGKAIYTLEDPVETEIDGVMQVQVNEEAGLTFASGIRSFMRHDPDVILVGEIRDLETLEMAIRCSLTGHLVLTTLHTNSAVESIARLVNLGADPRLIGDAMRAVSAQRMVRKVCQHCSLEVAYGDLSKMEDPEILDNVPSEIDRLRYKTAPNRYNKIRTFPQPYEKIRLAHPRGCAKCNFQGYAGRQLVSELMIVDQRVREMIATRQSTEKFVDYLGGTNVNYPNIWHHAGELIRAGVTTLKECELRLNPQQEFGKTFTYDREQECF